MPVTRDEVIYAYRLLLGREPESEIVIENTMAARDWLQLREAFLASQEFIGKYESQAAHVLPVGRFFDVPEIPVDPRCTDEQLQLMFDRIAAAWKIFGETEPHWSVIVSDDFRQANLADNIDRFYLSGRGDIDVHLNFLARAGLPTRFGRALDFGCGVGRLTLALAAHADQVVGVDISPPHLALAAERAEAQGIGNAAFESIDSVADLDRYGDLDFIISRIVLQHNPPPVMAALYRRLLTALKPGGVAIVQIPTYIQGQNFTAADYLANEQPSMEMNALPQKLVFEIIAETGCVPLEIREDSAAGHIGLSHTFAVQKA
ncbi:class I SAM-dependent methyltransferase [Rhizorhabdus sp.]|uniref:class I SAM-dependent methyltransferase n=1 Tax=Rhizorhabdus sp. TaxID=1968843 RepID=UPI001983244F|nr:class I SAM-dependent methyltransferase [Rhizorhabdus sp.]MBD3759551.1 class I SAM-dependent methyltransferase [Rhizorhabdus sp.]